MVYFMFYMFIFFKIYSTTATTGCVISINKDLNDPQPLLIKGNYGKIFPEPRQNSDEIYFNENKTFEVYCPGGTILVNEKTLESNPSLVSCIGRKFYINKEHVIFHNIKCSRPPKHHARLTGKTCLRNGKEFTIGFEHNSKTLPLITGCFDNIRKNTLYTISVIPKTIAGYQSGYPRPAWTQGSFYNITNVNQFYKRNIQQRTINNLLGLNEESTKYISKTGDYYLGHGHLAPKIDFLFGSQQSATFHCANSAPQWQTFNTGNWRTLEKNIRNVSIVRKLNLKIYTGTFEIASFRHESTGKLTQLFLHAKKMIPVPKYFWKIVVHEETESGVAFIGVNNPYIKVKDLDDYTLCGSFCDSLKYLNLSMDSFEKGYIYCCKVEDAKYYIDTIPSSVTTRYLLI